MISFSERFTPLSLSSLPRLEAVVVLSVSSLDSVRFMLREFYVGKNISIPSLHQILKLHPKCQSSPHQHKGLLTGLFCHYTTPQLTTHSFLLS